MGQSYRTTFFSARDVLRPKKTASQSNFWCLKDVQLIQVIEYAHGDFYVCKLLKGNSYNKQLNTSISAGNDLILNLKSFEKCKPNNYEIY